MFQCIEQDNLERRRSIYALGNTPIISDSCLLNTIASCVKHCPTAFNVQSSRIAALFDNQHHKFWNLVWHNLQNVITPEQAKSSKEKIESFKHARGTILFFEDEKVLKKLKQQVPLYKKNVNIWAQQANGMLQYMIWQALSENDIGASLQHYNEVIEKDVSTTFNIPRHWKLIAQMPWGSIEKEPAQKTFVPLEDRILVLK